MTSATPLPIESVLPELVEGLTRSGQIVLRAPTGAGKTTRVPQAILDAGLAGDGQVLVLEPRRIAARSAARRISAERGSPLGREVGYCVRFDERLSRETRILMVTEGVLLRKLQEDPCLEGVGAVVFDEFHERNLYSDVGLGMVRRVQQTVRPDLRVVVMSATLDPGPLAAYLGTAAVVESQGRAHPVEVRYRRRDRADRRVPRGPADLRSLPELVVAGVEELLPLTPRDLLVFLPGVGEIRRTERALGELSARHQLAVLPLYGDLPPEQQDRVLDSREQRKVVLATNVAETSLTIPGVTAVVDTGLARVLRFDPRVGLDRLEVEAISRASADQRAGRAGREQPGICLRLWDEESHRRRPEHDDPEVRRVDLAGPVLILKSWGERRIGEFPWFEAPREDAISQAEHLLRRLGALDSDGDITPHGQVMSRFPTHPRIARLLMEGHRLGQPAAAAGLAALLSERDPFVRSQGPPHTTQRSVPSVVRRTSSSDVLDRLRGLEEFMTRGTQEFPWGTVQRHAAHFLWQVRDQLARITGSLLGAAENSETGSFEAEEVLLRALLAAFPDRVARRRDVVSTKGLMVGGRGVVLGPQSSVHEGELFLCVDVEAGAHESTVRQASTILREWLPADALSTRVIVFFHPTQKQVLARCRLVYDELVLSETPVPLPDTEPTRSAAADALYVEARRAWSQVFPAARDDVQSYLQRVRSLAQWRPELDLPACDDPALHQILRSLCSRARSFAELQEADWVAELQAALTREQRLALDRDAPARWTVPSGRSLPLTYTPGQPPVLAVRIQEVFSLRETPRVAAGRIPVRLHLLAPNFAPQQVTDDLPSFWKNTYPAIRQQLARRYPRHPWPENPLDAPPVRK
jgi:ATP-dependent helicase HrpB